LNPRCRIERDTDRINRDSDDGLWWDAFAWQHRERQIVGGDGAADRLRR
jgi:hypothetical protein